MTRRLWIAVAAAGVLGLAVYWAVGPANRLPAPLLFDETVAAVSFPQGHDGAKRLKDPAQIGRLTEALRAAQPLRRRNEPQGNPDVTFCMVDASVTGPCLEYWEQAGLLKAPSGFYRAPAGLAALVQELQGQAR